MPFDALLLRLLSCCDIQFAQPKESSAQLLCSVANDSRSDVVCSSLAASNIRAEIITAMIPSAWRHQAAGGNPEHELATLGSSC